MDPVTKTQFFRVQQNETEEKTEITNPTIQKVEKTKQNWLLILSLTAYAIGCVSAIVGSVLINPLITIPGVVLMWIGIISTCVVVILNQKKNIQEAEKDVIEGQKSDVSAPSPFRLLSPEKILESKSDRYNLKQVNIEINNWNLEPETHPEKEKYLTELTNQRSELRRKLQLLINPHFSWENSKYDDKDLLLLSKAYILSL